jgi:hypothetical protein
MAIYTDKYGRSVTVTDNGNGTSTVSFSGVSMVLASTLVNTQVKALRYAEAQGDPEIETGDSGLEDPEMAHWPIATATTPGLIKLGSGLSVTDGVVSATGGGGSSLTYDATPPNSPTAGARWMDSSSGIEFVYINDGTSSQWVNPIMTIGLDGIQYNPTLVTLDIIGNNTYGKGFRIAKSSAGNDSRVAGVQMGVSSTATDNTFLYNNIGTFTIYNGSDPTGTSLLSMSTSVSTFGTPVSFGNNEVRNSLLKKYSEVTASPTISSGTLTVDLSAANVFTVSLNANITTLTISNTLATSNTSTGFTLVLTADGTARTITWPGSVKWPAGTAPTLTSTNGKIDVLSFVSYDQGSTWLGFVGGQNF